MLGGFFFFFLANVASFSQNTFDFPIHFFKKVFLFPFTFDAISFPRKIYFLIFFHCT